MIRAELLFHIQYEKNKARFDALPEEERKKILKYQSDWHAAKYKSLPDEEQEKIKAQQQEMNSASVEMESGNPHKRKKKRGSAFAQGKKKTNQPDPASMSQTSEKAGKME